MGSMDARRSILEDLRSREYGFTGLLVSKNLPDAFLQKHDGTCDGLLGICQGLERLLRECPVIRTNADMATFSDVVQELCEVLGIQGRRTPEEADRARESFSMLGGAALLLQLLHAPLVARTPALAAEMGSAPGSGATADTPAPAVAESPDPPAARGLAALWRGRLVNAATSPRDGGAQEGVDQGEEADEQSINTMNRVLSTLTELALADPDEASCLSQQPFLLPQLFVLMQHPAVLDGAVSLAQELLAAGPDFFALDNVMHLGLVVESLPPRALALFCRTVAALFSKPEPPSTSNLPPPECVPPNLCAACTNRAALLTIAGFLPKVLVLLDSPVPPRGLWPTRPAEIIAGGLPAAVSASGTSGADVDSWDEFVQRSDGSTPPGRDTMIVLPADQVPPSLSAAPIGNGELVILRLSAFERELWTTLQADLLFVLATLLGNKARDQTQDRLIQHGFVEMMHNMFDRLDWRWTTPRHRNHHHRSGQDTAVQALAHLAAAFGMGEPPMEGDGRGDEDEDGGDAGGEAPDGDRPRVDVACSSDSCLQISLLRTLGAFCEKSNRGSTNHLLLLDEDTRVPLVHRRREEASRCRAIAAAADGGGGGGGAASAEETGKGASAAEGMGDEDGGGGGGKEEDNTAWMASYTLPGGMSPESSLGSQPWRHRCIRRRQPQGPEASTPAGTSGGGLLARMVQGIMSQPLSSPYFFEFAGALHKWTQGAAPEEQEALFRHQGFVRWLLQKLLATPLRHGAAPEGGAGQSGAAPEEEGSREHFGQSNPADIQQVLFDLLGEMVKFNEPAVELLSLLMSNASPSAEAAARRFFGLIENNMVNASVFIQSMELTLGATPKLLRRKLRRSTVEGPVGDEGAVQYATPDREAAIRGAALSPTLPALSIKALKQLAKDLGVWDATLTEKSEIEAAILGTYTTLCRHRPGEEGPRTLTGPYLCSFIATWEGQRHRTALQLLKTLKPGGAQCTDLCAINATIILLTEAFSADSMPALVDGIMSCIRPGWDPAVPEAAADTPAASVDLTIAPEDLAKGLKNAMDWWQRYYQHQQYEKKFMEYQTGVPFSKWVASVERIRAEVPDLILQHEA
uniref:Uncharacterized protein n=2 Tax=Rhizochromulina marina TaxID=1034831 RepID=A0A7S2WD35_9STRA|mmetsp:Transcript_21166/g.61785  ORF Transcript_21166/g.61785 Transcript_21166/m.61785 type:complete len:1089 (+) Transcript_21166:96-3362(+)